MDVHATPSVQFDFEDRQHVVFPPMQTADPLLLLEFSNTAEKPFQPDDTTSLKKLLSFEPTPGTLSSQAGSLTE
jgi:hypothetical protein